MDIALTMPDALDTGELARVLEAVLFASGEPVSLTRLQNALNIDRTELLAVADVLAGELSYGRRGVALLRLEDRLQLSSRAEYADIIRAVLETRKPPALSPVSIEVLAIVAYHQPVTRAYVESVRGVDSGYTVSSLVEKGLIEPCGRLDVPGRPMIYRTTDNFLRAFGLCSLDELPPLADVQEGEAATAADGEEQHETIGSGE